MADPEPTPPKPKRKRRGHAVPCPKCGCGASAVYRVQPAHRFGPVRRERVCSRCGTKFQTFESTAPQRPDAWESEAPPYELLRALWAAAMRVFVPFHTHGDDDPADDDNDEPGDDEPADTPERKPGESHLAFVKRLLTPEQP